MSKKTSWISWNDKRTWVLPIIALIIIGIPTLYLVRRANTSERVILQLNFFAILTGLLFEYWRLTKKWTTILLTALGAYVLSFLAFAKGKNNPVYIFEDRLQLWPYYFLGAFVAIATILQFKSVTRKLTEGITLLLTFAINYWLLENDYWITASIPVKGLIILNGLFSLFSIYHAFSYKPLSKGSRVMLSLWSSIILLVLAADNFLKLYEARDIEHQASFTDGLLVFIQFFLLGVSSIYIAQNLAMVAAYVPGKRNMERIRQMNDVHLGRYSDQQVYVFDSIIVTIISLAGFGLNYYFHYFPPNLMIWAMVTLAPFLLFLLHRATNRQ